MSIEDRIFQEQAGNTFYKVRANRALSMGVWSESDLPGVDDGAEYRGALVQIPGSTGVADKLLVMRKNAGNAYEWARVVVSDADAPGVMPVFNVKDYGALGDGTTNDHTAIAAAITAANAAGGGTVYFPAGTYLVDGSLGAAATNITIKGDGMFLSKIKLKNSGNAHVFDISGSKWRFENIGIDGNRANNTSGHGIRIAGDHHIMRSVYIHDTVGYGVACAQSDSTSLRYADFNHVLIVNAGTDGIDIKDKDSANVGNRLTNILVLGWDASASGDCAGVDCRGHVQLTNITCVGVSTNGAGVRFRPNGVSTGPVGARRSTLVNALIVGDGTTSSYGLAVNSHDVSASNVTIVDCWRGVADVAAAERAALTSILVINGFSRGYEINSDEGAVLTNCRAEGCVSAFRIVGDDVTLTACRSDDASSSGFHLLGARPILIGCRLKATGGTGLTIDAAATSALISGCDFTGQSGGTKVSDLGTGTVATENIGINDIGNPRPLIYTMDGAGVAITTGAKGWIGPFGYSGALTGWTLTSDTAATVTMDIWKDTLANHPPTNADSITASAKPSLSNATQNSSTTLTSWTTTFGPTDTFRFEVEANDNATLLTIQLAATRAY